MIKVVLTVQDDVCVKNGKDVNATELLKIMATYGKVERYDDCVAKDKAEYEGTIKNLIAQNEAISDRIATDDEFEVLKALRGFREKSVKVYVEENAKLTKTLDEVKTEHERTIEIIANVINKK